MAPRLVVRGKYNYHTESNKLKRIRTPGGRLTFQKIAKVRNPIICGDTGVQLNGIKRLNKCQWKNAPKRVRTVSRAYGGVLSAEAVRHRIIRAFLNEELKCIKRAKIIPKKKNKGGQQQKRKNKRTKKATREINRTKENIRTKRIRKRRKAKTKRRRT